jgi:hypothetical protein
MAFFVFFKVAVGTTAGIASRDNSNLSLQCNRKLRVTVDVLGGLTRLTCVKCGDRTCTVYL